MCINTYGYNFFSTGQKDTLYLYGKPKYLHYDFYSNYYNGNKSYNSRHDNKARRKMQTFFIKSPNQENLKLSMKFSTTYSSNTNTKVLFFGYDHRSWIDIVILYQEIVKYINSLFDIKYLHRTIHLSNDSGTYSIMNTLPNGGDQVLVFIADNPNNHAWKLLDMIITGKSYKTYESLDHTAYQLAKTKLSLWWNAQLQRVSGLHNYISLQGESHQLEVYFTQKCETKKTCPVPDQLHKYMSTTPIK